MGDSLALVIPSNASTIITRQDEPATVLWSSNAKLVAPDAKFEYKVEMFFGYYKTLEELEQSGMNPSVTMTADQNSNSVEIKGSSFHSLSIGDTPAYTVRVSMPHPDGEGEDVRLSALAWVIARPQPVQAEILMPENDTILDESLFGPNQLEVSYKLVSIYPKRQAVTLELTRIEEDGTVTTGLGGVIDLDRPEYDENTMIPWVTVR